MTAEENAAVVRRVFEDVWNRRDLARIDELFDYDFIRHHTLPGSHSALEAEKQHRADFLAAFLDLFIVAHDVIAARDRVVVRYTWRGTYQGVWPRIPVKGTRVTFTGIAIHRVVAGKVKELWVVGDELGLLEQLGAVSSPWSGEVDPSAKTTDIEV